MMKTALTITALTTAILATTLVARAQTVAEKKQRAAVDDVAAKAADDIKDCTSKIKVAFDWKAYDALDWKTIGKEKTDYYDSEANSLKRLGLGINKLCADKDYKAALGKVTTIIFRSTNNDKIRVKAALSGGTLTFDNYAFGGTRDAWDYEVAAKAVL